MTSVFIGGSRAVSRLNSVIRGKLDDLIARNCAIYVGDANGADKAIQQHFADRGYPHVTVFCMDRCRNNVGSWPTKRISHVGKSKDFAYYAAKDLAMAPGRQVRRDAMGWQEQRNAQQHSKPASLGKEGPRIHWDRQGVSQAVIR